MGEYTEEDNLDELLEDDDDEDDDHDDSHGRGNNAVDLMEAVDIDGKKRSS